jgi:hypothetical protein
MRKRGMQKLQTVEMRFLRSLKVYTGLDNIRKYDIRKELAVFATNARIRRYRQNCLEYVERMKEGRVPRHGPWCSPERENRSWQTMQ